MACIVLGHLGNWTIDRVVFTFHVPIFFFITGYFTNDRKNMRSFIKNKIRTLLIPYTITCLAIIIIGAVEGYFAGNAKDAALGWIYASIYGAGDSYAEPFCIKAIGAIWFLWATFWGSVFLRVSFKFNKYFRLCFVIGLFVAGYASRCICWFPFSIQAGACATLFMYMGYLLNDVKIYIVKMSQEAKIFGVGFAIVTWMAFIKNFQSFWLVHCDIGRGIIDIFGCGCACIVIMLISWLIDNKTSILAEILAFFGKYSLFVLCIHIIELNLFPWWRITGKLVQHGFPSQLQLYLVIAGKFLLISIMVWGCTRIEIIRKLFGFTSKNEYKSKLMQE